MQKTNLKKKALTAVEILERDYPEAVCSLKSKNAFELLVATRLSAQCTDKRVNMVTPELFRVFPDPESFKNAQIEEIEEKIKTCGLYRTKAKDLKKMAEVLVEKFGGEVPSTMEELTSLPGIGRKTANLILGDIFGQPAVVVDTHFIRITSRLGFHNIKDATKIEKIMRELLPPDRSNDFCHRIVLHGRAVCTAQSPKCDRCSLREICDYNA